MAAITIGAKELAEVHHGQNGCRIERGYGTFNSTDASGTIASSLGYIFGAKFTAVGTIASDEVLAISGTVVGGRINRSSGSYTVTRTGAAKTSGLTFFYELVGR